MSCHVGLLWMLRDGFLRFSFLLREGVLPTV